MHVFLLCVLLSAQRVVISASTEENDEIQTNSNEKFEGKSGSAIERRGFEDKILRTLRAINQIRENGEKDEDNDNLELVSATKQSDVTGSRSKKFRGATDTKIDEMYQYDYDVFHNEFFDREWELRSQSNMEPSKSNNFFKKYFGIDQICLPDDWQNGVGLIAVYCILKRGYGQKFTPKEIKRLTEVAKFWGLVYLVAGGAIWMICGYCCCCFQCRFCKPDAIRRETKLFLINNPPGVWRNEVGGTVEYTTNQQEKDAYRDLQIKAFAFV